MEGLFCLYTPVIQSASEESSAICKLIKQGEEDPSLALWMTKSN
jgi:hypothetical protein